MGIAFEIGSHIMPIERMRTGREHARLMKKSLRISISRSRSLSDTLSGSFLMMSS